MSDDIYTPTAKGYAVYSAWLEATAKKHNCSIEEARLILKAQWQAELKEDEHDSD